MLNEDISRKFYGLFTYPAHEYLPGFTELPTDHYYRAYYLAVYNVSLEIVFTYLLEINHSFNLLNQNADLLSCSKLNDDKCYLTYC